MPKKKVSPLNEDFDFKLMVTIASKNLLWFALFMTISVIIAFLILRYTAPTYEPTTVMRFSSENNAQSVLGINTGAIYTAETNRLAANIELMRSKVIVERAISKLPLQISYFAKGAVLVNELYKQSPFLVEFTIRDSLIYGTHLMIDFTDEKSGIITYIAPATGEKKTVPFLVNKWLSLQECSLKISVKDFNIISQTQKNISKDAYYFVLNRLSDISRKVLVDIQVVPLNTEAGTVQIKIKEANQIKGADIVNGIASEFNKYDIEKSSEGANKVLDFIDNTITQIDSELSNSENSIEDFKRKNKIISPDQAIIEVRGRYDDLQKQLLVINNELSFYERIKKDIHENNDIGRFLLSLYGQSNDNLIIQQIAKLQDLIDLQSQIKVQATENSVIYNSHLIKIKSQQDIITKTILNEESALKAKRSQIVNQLGDNDKQFGQLPGQQAEFGRLQRLFNINEKFYNLLLEKKAEFSIARAGYVSQHIILQEARSDGTPVSPNRPLIISLSLMIGFIASILLILTRYLLYNEINALEEIGQYTDAALLGVIPKYKREIPVSQLLVDKNPKSVISEAFRSIRTNLQFISNEVDAKVIAVTSTISGEGKTFNAINLAGVIAFSGKKVVILDFDMRKPKIHIGFNVENNRGISTILIGKDKAEECIIKSSLPNLDFITAGPIPPNPAELIINPRMDVLLKYLKTLYDIIIVDLPPVGIVSDGIPMMQKADYPIYILRANYSKKMFITQINKLITENNVNNLTIILNGIEMSKLKYGYGYGYSYGYGYGYGYSYGYGYYDEDDKKRSLFQRIIDVILRRDY
jgi:tyrosine-protein kinase Etk/Wzc